MKAFFLALFFSVLGFTQISNASELCRSEAYNRYQSELRDYESGSGGGTINPRLTCSCVMKQIHSRLSQVCAVQFNVDTGREIANLACFGESSSREEQDMVECTAFISSSNLCN